MNTTMLLHDLVARRLDLRWMEFCREHPNLGAAIDRTELVEHAVGHLREDPAYLAAMRAADLDEAQLTQAAAALEQIEHILTLLLPR